MTIPVARHENMTIARCAEPLEAFAQWCGGTLVTFEGRTIAVTMPQGSPELACWPGDYLLQDGDELVRLMAADADDVLPAPVITMLGGTA